MTVLLLPLQFGCLLFLFLIWLLWLWQSNFTWKGDNPPAISFLFNPQSNTFFILVPTLLAFYQPLLSHSLKTLAFSKKKKWMTIEEYSLITSHLFCPSLQAPNLPLLDQGHSELQYFIRLKMPLMLRAPRCSVPPRKQKADSLMKH